MANERDLQKLQDAYAEWGRGDYKRVDMFTADAEFVVAGPDPRTYMGHAGVRQGWFDFLTAWHGFRSEAVEILEGAQRGTYLVLVRLSARGRESSVPIEADGANLVVMRRGKIERFEMFWDCDAGLRAAGLAPRP